mmetsp:Transcript_26731/g.39720  ORF Transcript_26731/g.39720 Transcript_26731/m.39720 type:complete len:116 (-) Transcript_26731:399-746(-)
MVQNKCSLMIIGCSILFALVDDLSEMQKQNDKLSRLTQMELGNLGKEDVNWASMPMLSIDDASTTQGFATEGLWEIPSSCWRDFRWKRRDFYSVQLVLVLLLISKQLNSFGTTKK